MCVMYTTLFSNPPALISWRNRACVCTVHGFTKIFTQYYMYSVT